MARGDKVFISPDVTHQKDWVEGKVIDVENNPFVGVVISAQTDDGNIFFDREYKFKYAL
ncbi:MAG: transcriptional regulator [Paludibacteraceae bacterium]|nr:transcriptional regulator [Paludibacteraceae bacterium]